MNFENILKGWFTTLLGCALMGLSVYQWWMTEDKVDWYEIAVPFIAGFALLYMRDKISDYIGEFFKAIVGKITGGSPKP